MKKLLITSFLVCLCATSFGNQDRTVYICTGEHATTYHRVSDCKGLNNCKADIIAVTETKAINLGRRKCKSCWK